MIVTNIAEGISVVAGTEIEVIDPVNMFDTDGVLLAKSAAFWEGITREQKMIFGHHNALYSFPTHEGVAQLQEWIGDRTALEIGAGNGGWCKALGIRGVDNFMQEWPEIESHYKAHGQPVIKYGPHVERLDALQAIHSYNPAVVIAAWVTHKYIPSRHNLKGNIHGVDEFEVLEHVDEYIFIGNTNTHGKKPLFADMAAGVLKSHDVTDFIMGSPSVQSRASGGVDFMLRLSRK